MTSLSDFGCRIWQIGRYAVPDETRWSLFDPCIGWSPNEGYLIGYMSSNHYLLTDGTFMLTQGEYPVWKTFLSQHEESVKKFVNQPCHIQQFEPVGIKTKTGTIGTGRGIRDLRIFWRPDGWHYTGRVVGVGIAAGRIDSSAETPVLGSSDSSSRDWVPVAYGGSDEFDMIVGPNKVLRGLKVVTLASAPLGLERARMGPPVVPLDDGTFLGTVRMGTREGVRVWSPSRLSWVDGNSRNYWHRFIRMDGNGLIIEMTAPFVLETGGVEKMTGLAHDGYEFVLTWGRNDVSSMLGRISERKVLSLLKRV